MPIRINNNIPAINSQRILNITNRDVKLRVERLSSGLRVNRAADDAAGLSVSEGLRGEISGFAQGIRNSEQAIDLVQTAEGALSEMSAIILRMRELAVQSASSTVNDQNREAINAEFAQLVTEIDRIAQVTSYNNTALLAGFGNTVDEATSSAVTSSATTGVADIQISGAGVGNYTFIDSSTGDNEITLGNGVASQTIDVGRALDNDGVSGVVASGSAIIANFDRLGIQLTLSGQRAAQGVTPATDGYRDGDLDSETLVVSQGAGGAFQVGPDDTAVHRLQLSISSMRTSDTTLNLSGLSISSRASAQGAIGSIDNSINQLSRTRGDLGAIQNRLSTNIKANGVMLENDQTSESTIRDADIAEEVTSFARGQILIQSGLAAFAQANITAATGLSLLS